MEMTAGTVSGLRVTVGREDYGEVVRRLAGLRGVEVHGGDAARGVLVVVQEQATVDEHEAMLRRIQGLPGVRTADLVCVFTGPDAGDR